MPFLINLTGEVQIGYDDAGPVYAESPNSSNQSYDTWFHDRYGYWPTPSYVTPEPSYVTPEPSYLPQNSSLIPEIQGMFSSQSLPVSPSNIALNLRSLPVYSSNQQPISVSEQLQGIGGAAPSASYEEYLRNLTGDLNGQRTMLSQQLPDVSGIRSAVNAVRSEPSGYYTLPYFSSATPFELTDLSTVPQTQQPVSSGGGYEPSMFQNPYDDFLNQFIPLFWEKAQEKYLADQEDKEAEQFRQEAIAQQEVADYNDTTDREAEQFRQEAIAQQEVADYNDITDREAEQFRQEAIAQQSGWELPAPTVETAPSYWNLPAPTVEPEVFTTPIPTPSIEPTYLPPLMPEVFTEPVYTPSIETTYLPPLSVEPDPIVSGLWDYSPSHYNWKMGPYGINDVQTLGPYDGGLDEFDYRYYFTAE